MDEADNGSQVKSFISSKHERTSRFFEDNCQYAVWIFLNKLEGDIPPWTERATYDGFDNSGFFSVSNPCYSFEEFLVILRILFTIFIPNGDLSTTF
jgi:hypothetical protein